MSSRHSFTAYLERDDDEIEVEVEYEVTPYQPAQGPTYACGGQPEEGGSIELVSTKLAGVEIELTDDEETEILRQCGEHLGECEDFDRFEYLYEQWREQTLLAR